MSIAKRMCSQLVRSVLIKVYGKEALGNHNYSTVVSSMGFAGFVVGMLLFGKDSSKPVSFAS